MERMLLLNDRGRLRVLESNRYFIDRNTPVGDDAAVYERKPYNGRRCVNQFIVGIVNHRDELHVWSFKNLKARLAEVIVYMDANGIKRESKPEPYVGWLVSQCDNCTRAGQQYTGCGKYCFYNIQRDWYMGRC